MEVETTDTAEIKSINSLADSGATGKFIDWQYVKSCRLWTQKLSRLILVHNIDGTLNKSGSITKVVNLILWYEGHSERTLFAITSLGKEKLILGHSSLHKHNPEVNWVTREVKMSRCPPCCCTGFQEEVRQEQIVCDTKIWWKETCSTGPTLELLADSEEENFEYADCPELVQLKDRDCIFAIGLLPPAVEIRAGSTILQCLAKVLNSTPKLVPPP